MEETFGGLVADVEKAVRSLGFKIVNADEREKAVWTSGNITDDELRITIVRKGKVG